MTSPLIQLAERAEAASAEQQHEMLSEAWAAIHGPVADGAAFYLKSRFDKMLEAGAYESAAMTLVPEGCGVDLRIPRLPGGRAAYLWAINGLAGAAKAAIPALALTAAALRAIASQEQGE